MPKNVYFSDKVRSEQTLFEDIIIESIKMYGQDVIYLPRDIVDRNTIFGEDYESRFDNAYTIEMYIEDTETFGGEGDLFQKFGLEIRDEATFIVAKRSWERYVGDYTTGIRPNEGDLVYLPMSKKFFEISHVEHEQPFYQISNLPVYKLQCRIFEYNDEDFDTGIDDIDSLEHRAFQYTLSYTIAAGSITDPTQFAVGSTISQTTLGGVVISGEVLAHDYANQTINVGDISTDDGEYNEFFVSETQYISEDGVDLEITSIGDLLEFDNEPFAMNKEFETDANNIIDFSESNPFGEP